MRAASDEAETVPGSFEAITRRIVDVSVLVLIVGACLAGAMRGANGELRMSSPTAWARRSSVLSRSSPKNRGAGEA